MQSNPAPRAAQLAVGKVKVSSRFLKKAAPKTSLMAGHGLGRRRSVWPSGVKSPFASFSSEKEVLPSSFDKD
ncbi:MAG TPA: hypothetical protein PLY97_11395 [Acidocella sp.]|nr:hypothetical protein [Acidocella sp.]